MAKLSVIIPVYQVKLYLERCLNSILSQTFTDYEVILVDDGSTDGSQTICDDFAERYDFITVIHKGNGGLSSARNVGIAASSGKYIMFVDSDDLIHFKAAEIEIKYLEETNADITICSLKRFKANEEIRTESLIRDDLKVNVISGLDAEKELLTNPNPSNYVSSCGKIFKRELFDDIKFPEGKLFEDEFTAFKLFYKSNVIAVIDEELYFYFVNEGGITQNLNLNKRFDEYDAQNERILFFKEKKLIDLYHIALLRYLHTAQWDLMECQKDKQHYDQKRGNRFQFQYRDTLQQARREKLISFVNNYDYYVLAYPEKRNLLRLKRIFFKMIGKMK